MSKSTNTVEITEVIRGRTPLSDRDIEETLGFISSANSSGVNPSSGVNSPTPPHNANLDVGGHTESSSEEPPSNVGVALLSEAFGFDFETLFSSTLEGKSQHDKYSPLGFEDPVELLFCLFDPIKSGEVELYPWQIQELLRLSRTPCDSKTPLKLSLVANNGSGKDSYIIAPLAIWLCCCRIRSRTVITSASFSQLNLQTEAYIRILCKEINEKLQAQGLVEKGPFLIKKQHIVCTLTGSEIILFVTDEGGRAEGYHPFPDYSKGEVTVILNEAKTIPDIIFEHLSRCTYCRWLEISSTGNITGKFYKHFRSAREFPARYAAGERYARRVTSYDCGHISAGKIEQDKLECGENSPLFRSQHLSLFTSLEEQVVITMEALEKARDIPCHTLNLGIGRRAGLDLAAGGDETALYIWEENECIGSEIFHAKDTAEVTVPVLVEFFRKWKLQPDRIWADDGGVGHAINDMLRREGWNINLVRNQSPSVTKGQYGNRGAELWFSFGMIAPYLRYPKGDEKLIHQLSSRYYTQHKTTGKIILESKKEARAKGHGSPDRADAVVLAWCGIGIQDFMIALGKEEKQTRVVGNGTLTMDKLVEQMKDRNSSIYPVAMSGEYEGEDNRKVVRLNPVNILRSLFN